ncbi:MAG: hypothetical protein LBE91_08135 [Tannerella sp.]|jgi:hypothetical protein|nr:hypothetical protein [Tannerella sp.]
MQKKKTKIHQFDPVIFSIKLWITVNPDFNQLKKMFRDRGTGKALDFENLMNTKSAITAAVIENSTDFFGVLIVFKNYKSLTCKFIAHEATHAAGFIFNHIDEQVEASEPFAYLLGWISDCCWQIKTNSKNKIEHETEKIQN